MLKKEEMQQWITLILIAMASYWAVTNIDVIIGIFIKIIQVLSPFLIGLAIAYVLNIPMSKIENALNKVVKNKKFPTRTISIILSLIILLLIIAFVLFLLVPEVISSIENLIATLPGIINDTEKWIIDLLDKYPDVQSELTKIFANNKLDTLIPNILNYIVNGTVNVITNLINGMITLFTATVFSIYILSQKEYIIGGTKKIIKAYLKPTVANRVIEIGNLSNKIFSKFISGQCVEAVILGIIMFIAFTICRFPYALIIAVLTAVTALIPIFGAMIAMIVGAILIAIVSPVQAVFFIIVFQVIQQIEGNFIYPKVVGKSVGLSPLWTLFAIMLGGNLFGIIGMLTFLPLASICYALLKDDISRKINNSKVSIKE